VVGLVVLAVLAGALWQDTTMRHRMLRVLGYIEPLVYPVLSGSPPQVTPNYYLHRAHAGGASNSAPAIEAARGIADRIEIDVCFTSDLVLFLSHGDDFAGATPDGLDFETLTAADVSGVPRSDGTPFLRFEQFLAQYAGQFADVIVDVKTDHTRASAKAEQMAALTASHDNLIFTSLSGVFLLRFKRLLPEARMGCELYGPVAAYLAGLDGYHADLNRVTRRRDGVAWRLGLRRLYYTADTPGAQEYYPEGLIVARMS